MAKRADRRHLVEVAYASDDGLVARMSLYDHQHPRVDLVAEALDLLHPLAGAHVVDVGCGNGQYLAALAHAGAIAVGADLSAGMLSSVAHPLPRVAADAQELPFDHGAFDVALMMHMLYHVPEPGRALDEARRILGRDGRLLAATNGARHLAEMNELWMPLVEQAGLLTDVEDRGLVNPRLPADALRRALDGRFTILEERVLRSTVTVTEPDPVIGHAASTTAAHVAAAQGADLVQQLRARVESILAADGEFRVTTEVVMFLARPTGESAA